ncbi:hypothetical protein [Inquilinus sp. OTU3971]|uniref:hypothetical protein n=1 Tax=Inquilinus sp. OTU3971 TaxID=3043855 RepID=UPI00313CF6D3
MPVEHQLSRLVLVDDLEAVVGRHVEGLDQCPVQAVGQGAKVFGRFASGERDAGERYGDLRRLDAQQIAPQVCTENQKYQNLQFGK